MSMSKTATSVAERAFLSKAPSDAAGAKRLAAHLFLLAGAGTLLALANESWLVLPAMLVYGLILIALFAPLHECLHRTAFRSRRLNDGLAAAIGFVVALFLHVAVLFIHFPDMNTLIPETKQENLVVVTKYVPPPPKVKKREIVLEGNLPSVMNPPKGCPFSTRCPHKIGRICDEERPPVQMASNSHAIACHITMEQLRQMEPVIVVPEVEQRIHAAQ